MKKQANSDSWGLVVKVTGKWCEIIDAQNKKRFPAVLRGKMRQESLRSTHPVAVGDWVKYESTADQNLKVITEIGERKNYIVRKATNKREKMHILAANIDQAALIITLKSPKTPPILIDKFLLVAESYSIPVLLLFNKTDLYGKDILEKLQKLTTLYSELGYRCLTLSLETSSLPQELITLLGKKITLLSGLSGVGKSTLINRLIPKAKVVTREISSYHHTGKHTTSFSEAYPLDTGGLLIDTPGVREFGIFDTKKENVSHYFREMINFAQQCKYRNCLHIDEKNCGVKENVAKNHIAKSRYANYINILKHEFSNS